MPHDRKGDILHVGDIVNLPCKVVSIQPNEDYCNASVETVEPMHPGTYKSSFTVNTKQVEKV